jgi:hypothetical protein
MTQPAWVAPRPSTLGFSLHLEGRGFDVTFVRTYRGHTLGAGPLGPGWDHNYNERLRRLPDGSVEHYDGRGRRELFQRDGDGYVAPPGVSPPPRIRRTGQQLDSMGTP